ncbi:MAG: hypothetical protein P8017_02585, partial [Deltaproteobacteria bacterium]
PVINSSLVATVIKIPHLNRPALSPPVTRDLMNISPTMVTRECLAWQLRLKTTKSRVSGIS